MSTSKSSPPRRNRLSLLSLHALPSFRLDARSRSPPVKHEAETAADSSPETPDSQPDREPVLKSIRRRSTSFLVTLMPILNSPPADTPPPARRKRFSESPPILMDPSLSPEQRDSTSSSWLDEGMIGLGISAPDHPPPPPPQQPDQSPPAAPSSPETPPAVLHKHRKVASLAGSSQQPGPQLSEARSSTFPVEFQISKTPASPQRLRKSQERSRGSSPQPNSLARDLQALLQPHRRLSPSPEPRGRSTSAQPTTKRSSLPDGQRVVSSPAAAARPSSSHSSDDNRSPGDHGENHGESRGRLRRSWLPTGRSRSNSHDMGAAAQSEAWIISPESQVEYDVAPLLNGEKVPELWNETGSVYVHLHPKGSGLGPSFRVPAEAIASSVVFNDLIQTELSSPTSTRGSSRSFGDQLSVQDAARIALSPPDSPPLLGWESRLYIPAAPAPAPAPPAQDGQGAQPGQPGGPDFDRLVALRNLFAFLTRQPLIGTKASPTAFTTFLQIAALLREFGFASFDGVSFGEEADVGFTSFIEQLGLADVRHSREKTIEALVLGEHMRSWDLYNEAFTHAVGKYQAILGVKSQLYGQVSVSTRQRLERAHLDLQGRQHDANLRLGDFDFPSLFAGVASSTSNPAYRAVRFKSWRAAFARMRGFMLGYYKNLFGNWPPRARSKKNPFSEGGLNRQVLRALYSDLCSLYDLLVNREEITRRVIDQMPQYTEAAAADGPHVSALRQMLSEFDSSSPPVLPPIPYDIPKVPTMASVLATYDDMPPKDQARFDKRLQPHELLLVLHKSYNFDTDSLNTPFLAEFKEFDLRESRGRTAGEMLDHRMGTWLFLYVVLQSLPMLVVDAPGLRFTEGVEYFLCEPPQGNLPWMEDAGEIRKAWYQVPGQGIVELSADVVMFSVEATYYRSHCWLAAKQWEAGVGSGPGAIPPAAAPPPALPSLDAPRLPTFHNMEPFGGAGGPAAPAEAERRGSSPSGGLRPRNSSIGGDRAYRASVLAIGLEPIPLPEGVPSPADRRVSRVFSGPLGGELALPPMLPRPQSVVVPRSRSAANLDALLPPESPPVDPSKDRQASLGGSTFDDILKDLDNQKKPKKKFGF